MFRGSGVELAQYFDKAEKECAARNILALLQRFGRLWAVEGKQSPEILLIKT
jgi:hypothetical protein